jgi:hypothetical protein
LLADFHDLDQLGRIRVEVDHVAGFLGRRGSGVHGHAYARLGECRCVVGSIPGHRDELAALLLALDQRHLVLGLGFRQDVVDPGLVGDGLSSQRIVTSDHHGADAQTPSATGALAPTRWATTSGVLRPR